MNSWARPRFCGRAIIAGAIACLFLLKGLALAASPGLMEIAHGGGGSIVDAAVVGKHCDAHGGEGAPLHGDHSHSQCCIFCAASGRDASFSVVAAFLATVIYLMPEAAVSTVRFFTDDPDGRPIGWTSSWSSRAPPFFS